MEYDKEKKIRLIQEIQATVEQMRLDDIEEQPEAAEEDFQCPCCGMVKLLAGSVIYNQNMFCNDCVLLTEISLALGKIKFPDEMIAFMADRRFENIYEDLFNNATDTSNN
jgi:hypothetical protein